jgi:hypothetical protein
MYYLRTPLLDVPQHLLDKIVNAIEDKNLIPTNMQEYSEFYSLEGFSFDANLHNEIMNHSNYCDFFSLVPDEPKLTLVIAKSKNNFPIHSDNLKRSSLTCCIKGNYELSWYVPDAELSERVIIKAGEPPLYSNVLNPNTHKLYIDNKIIKKDSVMLNSCESILFNHNTYHTVCGKDIDMTLIQFGFLNITQQELENIYNKWKLEKENK